MDEVLEPDARATLPLPPAPEIREELSQAIEAFNKEIQAAHKKRAA